MRTALIALTITIGANLTAFAVGTELRAELDRAPARACTTADQTTGPCVRSHAPGF